MEQKKRCYDTQHTASLNISGEAESAQKSQGCRAEQHQCKVQVASSEGMVVKGGVKCIVGRGARNEPEQG